MLLVALALKRDETQVAGLDELQQRSGSRDQRGGLIKMAVEAVQHPIQFRDAQRRADSRTGSVFANARARGGVGRPAGKMRLAHAAHQRKPGSRAKFVLDELFFEISGGRSVRCEIRIAAVVEKQAEEVTVLLRESVESGLEVISVEAHAERGLSAFVF